MAIYAPHFLPGANRDSRHLSQLEAWIFGIAAGLSAFTGVSRMGAMISAGALVAAQEDMCWKSSI
jgi:undecaprenyl pyrophosphate phosphatase UppP